MDPTANLDEQIKIATRMQACADTEEHQMGHSCTQCEDDGERLAELVLALNEWINGGGFLPQPYQRNKEG